MQPTVVEDQTELALRAETRHWLRKHGFPLPIGRLTKQQAAEIRECFDVLDADRSGTLDIDELSNAFNMLGFQVRALPGCVSRAPSFLHFKCRWTHIY